MSPSRLIGLAFVLAGGAMYAVGALTPAPTPDQLQRTTGRLDGLDRTHPRTARWAPVLLVGGHRFVVHADSAAEDLIMTALRPGIDTVQILSLPSRGGGMADVWQLLRRADILLAYDKKLAIVQQNRSSMKTMAIVVAVVGLVIAASGDLGGWSAAVKQ